MKKRAGPELGLKKVPLKLCPECKGNGTIKPMFHEMLCARCNGLGGVDNETGEALNQDNVTMQLRIRLRERAQAERQLRRQLADRTKETDDSARPGYGAGGAWYRGD